MGTFLGWATYDLKMFCEHCQEYFDPEYKDEHMECEEVGNELEKICDD
jgi:hypothetical protein